MSYYVKTTFLAGLLLIGFTQTVHAVGTQEKPKVLVVLGSARDHSVSKKIAHSLQQISTALIDYEIVDLQAYKLPLVDPEETGSNRGVNAWRKKFEESSAAIFLVPNYNAGYSGILKNGIDALGESAQDKKVAVIAYSGGYDGGQEALDALMPVLTTLHMDLIGKPVLIRMAENAFDQFGNLNKVEVTNDITRLLDTVYTIVKK